MQLRNSFMKITWLLMLGSVISCVLEKTQEMRLIFKGLVMKNSKEQKMLGVTRLGLDNKLTFKSHSKNLCKEASRK